MRHLALIRIRRGETHTLNCRRLKKKAITVMKATLATVKRKPEKNHHHYFYRQRAALGLYRSRTNDLCEIVVHQLILLVIFSSHLKQDLYLFYWLELSNKRIDLKSLVGVFMVLGAGLLLAFLTLIAEVLGKRKRKQKVIEN